MDKKQKSFLETQIENRIDYYLEKQEEAFAEYMPAPKQPPTVEEMAANTTIYPIIEDYTVDIDVIPKNSTKVNKVS